MNSIWIPLVKYFLLFIAYSFGGWIIEVINCSIREKKIANRGFLIGPICPVYGFGGLFITLLLTRYYSSPPVVFVMAIVICAFLEYLTSWGMEKIFKARWWDYSNDKLNLNGRICIRTLIPFGILGLVIVYGIDPLLNMVFEKVSVEITGIIAIILLAITIIDVFVSVLVIKQVTNTTIEVLSDRPKDNTNQIKEEVKMRLQGVFGARRLIEAFPDFDIIKEKIKIAMQETREKIEKVAEENDQKIKEIKRKQKEKHVCIFENAKDTLVIMIE